MIACASGQSTYQEKKFSGTYVPTVSIFYRLQRCNEENAKRPGDCRVAPKGRRVIERLREQDTGTRRVEALLSIIPNTSFDEIRGIDHVNSHRVSTCFLTTSGATTTVATPSAATVASI